MRYSPGNRRESGEIIHGSHEPHRPHPATTNGREKLNMNEGCSLKLLGCLTILGIVGGLLAMAAVIGATVLVFRWVSGL